MKLIVLAVFLAFEAYCETQVFEGVARIEGEVAYYEHHTVVYDNNTIISSHTEYANSEGKVFATLKSDFTRSLGTPAYILKDERHQTIQGIQWVNDNPEMFSQDRRKQIRKTSEVPMVAGPGLIYFIGQHLHQLIRQKELNIKLLIPGKLDAYDFLIQVIVSDEHEVVIEVKIRSWLMRIFSPRIRLTYDLKKKRLKTFEGLSHLRDAKGELMSVDIQYQYEK